jgi:hypothetical protein
MDRHRYDEGDHTQRKNRYLKFPCEPQTVKSNPTILIYYSASSIFFLENKNTHFSSSKLQYTVTELSVLNNSSNKK